MPVCVYSVQTCWCGLTGDLARRALHRGAGRGETTWMDLKRRGGKVRINNKDIVDRCGQKCHHSSDIISLIFLPQVLLSALQTILGIMIQTMRGRRHCEQRKGRCWYCSSLPSTWNLRPTADSTTWESRTGTEQSWWARSVALPCHPPSEVEAMLWMCTSRRTEAG